MASIRRRRCERCGQLFNPTKPTYRRCEYCFNDSADIGFTHSRQSRGRPDRHIGGISRRHDRRRSLILRGDAGRNQILSGYQQLATDIYDRKSGLSSFLHQAGMPREQYIQLQDNRIMDNYLAKLCPEFRRWLIENLGDKAMELIIDLYGLYGDPILSLNQLQYNLGLDDAERYQDWALSQMRRKRRSLETLFRSIAEQVMGGN